MTVTHIPLPYPANALEPVISQNTLEFHHGKHHKGYVDKVNDAIAGTPLEGQDLEAIVRHAHEKGEKGLFNNSAQTWNHGFYWNSLTPEKTEPDADLKAAIERDFGSVEKLVAELLDESVKHFASGWGWLVARDGKLVVISTHDADTPLVTGDNPLLTIDVWEHAYYLDVQNRRPDYVKGVIDQRLNWAFASENFSRGTPWKYA